MATKEARTLVEPIALTDKEREIFALLLSASAHANLSTVLRSAGGWVRDRLLGKESSDIDIALDNMMGKEFAEKVNEYLRTQGRQEAKCAVIQSNPEQSKHLETARLRVDDVWIDLVNLRSETYAEESRIPTMQFGTPTEDALRRDFTINSMFYNINTGSIEDFTGKGMQDLRAGIIRTPLPASETFMDDPLRVLRAVRFAARFGFELDNEIVVAASSVKVRTALGSKVSRERVGTEFMGMLNGPAPAEACRLLHQLQLFPQVFGHPPELLQGLGDGWGAPCVSAVEAAQRLISATMPEGSAEERRQALLAALLLPLRRCRCREGKKEVAASGAVIRSALKWPVKDVNSVAALHAAAPELLGVLRDLRSSTGGAAAGEGADDVRVRLGHAIRKLKEQWHIGMLLASLLTMTDVQALCMEGGGGAVEDIPAALATDQSPVGHSKRLEMVGELRAFAEASGLQDCWMWKPLLNGNQVVELMGWSKPGPQVAEIINKVMDWQLTHPAGSVEECKRFVLGGRALSPGK